MKETKQIVNVEPKIGLKPCKVISDRGALKSETPGSHQVKTNAHVRNRHRLKFAEVSVVLILQICFLLCFSIEI